MLQRKARAKINLDLRVLDRRPDGYHNLNTLFARIGLHDSVTVSATESGIELVVSGDAGGAEGPDNLAYRAAAALSDRLHGSGGIRIELTKRIPTGAGLGGGSADAAATLRLVNELWGRPLTDVQLVELGATLGADVPFLTAGLAAAWGAGTGDELTPTSLPSDAAILLSMPPVHVGTAQAYQRLGEFRAGEPSSTLRAAESETLKDWESLASHCANDFEAPVHALYPELAALHGALGSSGAFMARMSGSGAAHFALFHEQNDAEAAKEDLIAAYPEVTFVVTHFE